MQIDRDMLRTALSLADDWPRLGSDDIAEALEAAYEQFPADTVEANRNRFLFATGYCEAANERLG